MICNECQNKVNDYQAINDIEYCIDCIHKYCLIPCPGSDCLEVVSLNGYDIYDISETMCTSCNAVYCEYCIVKDRNITMCKDCFND